MYQQKRKCKQSQLNCCHLKSVFIQVTIHNMQQNIPLNPTRTCVEQERRRGRCRYWVAEVQQRRQARGNLVQELHTVDSDSRHAYFRMNRETFDLLLSKTGLGIWEAEISKKKAHLCIYEYLSRQVFTWKSILSFNFFFENLFYCYKLVKGRIDLTRLFQVELREVWLHLVNMFCLKTDLTKSCDSNICTVILHMQLHNCISETKQSLAFEPQPHSCTQI